MIVEGLLNLVYLLFEKLTVFINVPGLPEDVYDMIGSVFEYIAMGLGLVSVYTHMGYLTVLLFIVVAVNVGLGIYYFIMWILRKIPLLGID